MKKFNPLLSFLVIVLLSFPALAQDTSQKIKKTTKSLLYTNMVDQAIYYEATNMLRLDRLYRKIFNKKVPAEDVNVYDQLPDSSFFENRHAKTRLSSSELTQGYSENSGPSPEGPITVIKGKTEGLHPGFFVADAKGDHYLLKFDSFINLELNTSAEVISSRFYHAIGYHVPQYTIFSFDPSRLTPSANATMVDRSGFENALTPEQLQVFMFQLPKDSQGFLRASASKILEGENMGPFSFQGKRKNDPLDTIDHEKRRSIRALQVFASWLNNNDVRHGNTIDMLITENGQSFIRHYLIDFNATLGGAAGGAKPPMFSHEHFLDYGSMAKGYLGLGFREAVWQKRQEERSEIAPTSPAIGYFDNVRFSPEDYKVQLPYYAFKDLTRADGYWAAKIIMSFSDDDIRSMVKAGKLTLKQDEETLVKILSERRDLIGECWFSKSSPLESFNLSQNTLSFIDLGLQYGFSSASTYAAEINSDEVKKQYVESSNSEIKIPLEFLNSSSPVTLHIRAKRPQEDDFRPYVLVELTNGSITRVLHEN